MDKKIQHIEKLEASKNIKRVGIISINGKRYVYGKRDLVIVGIEEELREEATEWLKNNK